MKDEVYEIFISKGESKEHILTQDIVEITGNDQKAVCVGGIGGLLGQFILCLSTIQSKWKDEAHLLNPTVI